MLSFFPRGVLDEILNLIESVSGGFSFLLLRLRFRTVSKIWTRAITLIRNIPDFFIFDVGKTDVN